MIALYVSYLTEDHLDKKVGDVSHVQAKVKGFAPAVADMPRSSWESVVRYSPERVGDVPLSAVLECKVDEDRRLVMGGTVILEEDAEWSTKFHRQIEEL